MQKEACIESFAMAKAAEKAGATRIELCENLAVGGTTPSYGTIKQCVEQLSIPSFVMIRPRGGDFCYSEDELKIMEADIDLCKQLKVPAVVFGLLTSENKIDIENTRRLVQRSQPMQVTFHKAFDELDNQEEAMEQLISIGVDRILTSGACATAEQGAPFLKQLVKKAKNRIQIVVAGKVSAENINSLSSEIHAQEYHGKKIVGDLVI